MPCRCLFCESLMLSRRTTLRGSSLSLTRTQRTAILATIRRSFFGMDESSTLLLCHTNECAVSVQSLTALCEAARFLRHHRSGHRHGIDSKRESIDLAHDDAFSSGNGNCGDGVPKLAVHEDFSGRCKRGLRNSNFSDQALLAGYDFIAAGAHGDAHPERPDNSERDADGQRGCQANAHFGNGCVDQKQAAHG